MEKISSLLYMTEELITIKKIRVEYLSTKQDKYNQDVSYFKIKDFDIDTRFAIIKREGYIVPMFKSENGITILKTKQKYVKLKEPKRDEIVTVDIGFHYYKMNGIEGYYVRSLG